MENSNLKYTEPDRTKFGVIYDVGIINKSEEKNPLNDIQSDPYRNLGKREEAATSTVFFKGESDEFMVEFREEVDTGKRVVRFTKPRIKKQYDFTVSSLQLPHMIELKYSGYRIEDASMMQAYVRERCRATTNKPIADSIGFAVDRNSFYNCDFEENAEAFNELLSCWKILLNSVEFTQILLCSVMGIGSAYLDKRIFPVVNIWGAGVNPEFLKTLILSPFGRSVRGYRDVYCREKKDSKLTYDRDIVPVIYDLVTYEKQNAYFERSGEGYYIDGHGQYHAPLFILSRTPYYKDVNINIKISSKLSLGKTEFLEDEADLLYRQFRIASEVLLKHSGQLSLHIGNKVCALDINTKYRKNLSDIVEMSDSPLREDALSRIDALGLAMQEVLSDILDMGEDDWRIDWMSTVANAEQQAKAFYFKLQEFIEQNKKSISQSDESYKDGDCGFWSFRGNKTYLHIQEGAFSKYFEMSLEEKISIFDFWLDKKHFDNSPKGASKTQPYQKRIQVGGDDIPRKRFYRFCISDLEMEYPTRQGAKSK